MSVSVGIGARPELFEVILGEKPNLTFLEAHSENYFGNSFTREKLFEVREHYPLSLHGVGLSLGRADNLNQSHLIQLKQLVDEVEPILVSEHLSWSAYSHQHVPDLLPLPLNEQSLTIMCQHVEQMQDFLQRQILVENPSNYLLFDQLQIPEPEFLNTLAKRTGCQLLVDVNNIYVSSVNIKRDALSYVHQLDSAAIGQYHLAGYTEVERDGEPVLIDTHNKTVYEPVWQLFRDVVAQHGPRPALFEWDSDFPEFQVLLDECEKAKTILQEVNYKPVQKSSELLSPITKKHTSTELDESPLESMQADFLREIFTIQDKTLCAKHTHQQRISIYQNNVFAAVRDYLTGVFPAAQGVLGCDFFKQLTTQFIQSYPPAEGNIHVYGAQLIEYVAKVPELDKLPYIADLLRYEWALHDVYFSNVESATAKKVEPHTLTQEQLLTLPVSLNRSVAIIKSPFPIYEIHRQSLPAYEGDVAIDLSQSQDTLMVYKIGFEVLTRHLTSDEWNFFQQLNKVGSLLKVIESLQGEIAPDQLSAILAFVFDAKLLLSEQPCQDSQVA